MIETFKDRTTGEVFQNQTVLCEFYVFWREDMLREQDKAPNVVCVLTGDWSGIRLADDKQRIRIEPIRFILPEGNEGRTLEDYLAAEVELVAPCQGELPALGLDGAVVAVGGGSAVDAGKFRAADDDVGVVADVVVAREGEPAAEYIPVQTYVIGGYALPGEVVRNDGRTAGVGGPAAVDEDAGLAGADRLEEAVGADVGIAQGADVGAQLKVVQPRFGTLEPGLFAYAPAKRCGGEECPLLACRELRGTVVTGGYFENISTKKRVVDAAEETCDGVV